jgi:tRNA(Ile)-lysidine synthase TilS/MesJ
VLQKVRAGIRGHGAVIPNDHVAIAVSGGPSSSLLCHVAKLMQTDRRETRGKDKIPFTLVLVHVKSPFEDEKDPNFTSDQSIEEVKLEDVFLDDENCEADRKCRLLALLESVSDVTGRQDLLEYLKLRVLLTTAIRLGCSKLLLGHNALNMSVRNVAATVKGRGYALPGDFTHIDTRHVSLGGPAVVYPLKDVSQEEVNALCGRLGLISRDELEQLGKVLNATLPRDKDNINTLAMDFIKKVQGHNPGVTYNINSTISKLRSFCWTQARNGLDTGDDDCYDKDTGGAGDDYNDRASDSDYPEILCPLCYAPLADDEVLNLVNPSKSHVMRCACDSCCNQILFAKASFSVTLLPTAIQAEMNALHQASARMFDESDGDELSGTTVHRVRARLDQHLRQLRIQSSQGASAS